VHYNFCIHRAIDLTEANLRAVAQDYVRVTGLRDGLFVTTLKTNGELTKTLGTSVGQALGTYTGGESWRADYVGHSNGPLIALIPNCKAPHRGMWAPGGYVHKCSSCGGEFVGDKRACHCAPCAYWAINPEPPRSAVAFPPQAVSNTNALTYTETFNRFSVFTGRDVFHKETELVILLNSEKQVYLGSVDSRTAHENRPVSVTLPFDEAHSLIREMILLRQSVDQPGKLFQRLVQLRADLQAEKKENEQHVRES
jgi:hypothetical protein